MDRSNNISVDRVEVIKAKLEAIALDLPAPPPWLDALRGLSAASGDEERLAVYQAVRDSGDLPAETGLMLVSLQIDDMVNNQPQPTLVEFERQLQAIATAHGFDDGEIWDEDQRPPEYQELYEQYQAAWKKLYLDELLARGERELGQQFRDDSREYERRQELGRRFLFGSIAENKVLLSLWLDKLVAEVENCVECFSPMGPLGYYYVNDGGLIELTVFPTPVELVGGRNDGGVVNPDFSLDVSRLVQAFDGAVQVNFSALGLHAEDCSYTCFEGTFRGQDVFLQVLAVAPEGEEPGLQVDATERRP